MGKDNTTDFIIIKDLCKSYAINDKLKIQASNHLNLAIPTGEIVALMGPSGSGKSTLLQQIGLIDAPDSGEIIVAEQVISILKGNAAADYRSSIGFVFQAFHLLDSFTLAQNVAAPLMGRIPVKNHRKLALNALDLVGLAERADSYPNELSGGQQQRVAIARAIVSKPKLLLADEPTGNLDSKNSEMVMELLLDLHQELGLTMVIATHDPKIAANTDRVLVFRDGKINAELKKPTLDELVRYFRE